MTSGNGEDTSQALAVGMLLWEPRNEKHGWPGNVWCVKSVAKKSARIIYAADGAQVEGTIRQATVPKGWRVVNNAPLWKHLEQKDGGTSQSADSPDDGGQ